MIDSREDSFKNKIKNIDNQISIEKIIEDPYFFAISYKNSQKGIIDFEGNTLLDFKYSDINQIDRYNLRFFDKKTNKVGVFSLLLKKITLNPEFSKIQTASKIFNRYEGLKHSQVSTILNYFFVTKDKFSGYSNANTGEVFLPN